MYEDSQLISILSETECWDLLSSVALGRLVTSVDGQPEIFPLNFVVQHRTVLFRTAEGAKLVSVNAQPQRVDATALPWSYDVTTTEPAVFANVVAQGDSDSIGCRIIIDGVVKDERSVNKVNAYTFCLDKSG